VVRWPAIIRTTFWVLQGTLAIALLVTKVLFIDRHDNWLR